MKQLLYLLLFLCLHFSFAQTVTINGIVQNAANDKPLENVNIFNIGSIKGSISKADGSFEIDAKVNDSLYFSYLGFKPFKTRVSNDWIKYGNIVIKLTELGIALEEVVVSSHGLTGFMEIDVKNIPVYTNVNAYAITGLNKRYEGGSKEASGFTKTVNAILNPINSVYNLFNKKSKQLRRLRKIKDDEQIRNLLLTKVDRETLVALTGIDKVDLDEILLNCNYSKDYIQTANDLQILDAISNCYEEYKVLNR